MKKIATRFALTLLTSVALGSPAALAANIEFKAASGGQDFAMDSSWVGDFVPTSSDWAVVNTSTSGIDYAYLEQPFEVLNLSLGRVAATTGALELRSSASLRLLGAASGANRVAYVGEAGNGELTLLPGAHLELTQSDLRVGNNNGAFGTVVQGTSSTAQVGGHVVVGQLNGSQGSYAMNGSSLNVSAFVIVGREGRGDFTQTAGNLSIHRDDNVSQPAMFIGSHNTGNGYYEISGGSLVLAEARNAGLRVGTANGLAQAEFRVVGGAPEISVGTGLTANPNSIIGFSIDTDIAAIDVAGNVQLAGLLDVDFSTQPSPGDTFTLINYGGTLTGQFAGFTGWVNGPNGPGSVQVAIDYGSGSGDSITLTVAVPEPATGLLALLPIAGVLVHRRRRKQVS